MFKAFINIFRVPELRNKVLFTLFMLAIYRIGYSVPLPGVDQKAIADLSKNDESTVGRLASYVSLFSGGSLQQSTIFGLGIMPYISSSIIFQLLGTVVPSLEKLQKEGGTGQRKIQEWSRYATVPLCVLQAIIWLRIVNTGPRMVLGVFLKQYFVSFWLIGVISLTAGSIFLMWLGEQIDEYGLGNGISLVILAGIVARMPGALVELVQGAIHNNGDSGGITPGKIVFLVACFIFVVAGSIVITQAQRRIPVQQAKHTRGRRVYGGQKQFLPLRVNHGGVMPIIFAQSLMLFPGMLFGVLVSHSQAGGVFHNFAVWLDGEFKRGQFLYLMTEVVMIYFFAYFGLPCSSSPRKWPRSCAITAVLCRAFVPASEPAITLKKWSCASLTWARPSCAWWRWCQRRLLPG